MILSRGKNSWSQLFLCISLVCLRDFHYCQHRRSAKRCGFTIKRGKLSTYSNTFSFLFNFFFYFLYCEAMYPINLQSIHPTSHSLYKCLIYSLLSYFTAPAVGFALGHSVVCQIHMCTCRTEGRDCMKPPGKRPGCCPTPGGDLVLPSKSSYMFSLNI